MVSTILEGRRCNCITGQDLRCNIVVFKSIRFGVFTLNSSSVLRSLLWEFWLRSLALIVGIFSFDALVSFGFLLPFFLLVLSLSLYVFLLALYYCVAFYTCRCFLSPFLLLLYHVLWVSGQNQSWINNRVHRAAETRMEEKFKYHGHLSGLVSEFFFWIYTFTTLSFPFFYISLSWLLRGGRAQVDDNGQLMCWIRCFRTRSVRLWECSRRRKRFNDR